ncbi:MAG: FG-GAP-like repeat-containing protein [Myxococcota bacterium]
MTEGTTANSTLARLIERFPDVRITQAYGMSEFGVLRTRSAERGSPWLELASEHSSVRLAEGQLEVNAPSTMLGYHNADAPFTADGWLKTGDLAELVDGRLRILGRASSMINVGGLKVNPARVEEVVSAVEGVADVLVAGEPNGLVGALVAARVCIAQDFEPLAVKKRIRERSLVSCTAVGGVAECGSCPEGLEDVNGDGTRCEGVPSATDDAVVTDENTGIIIDVLASDVFGPDGAGSFGVAVSQPAFGTVAVNGVGAVEYTPRGTFVGVEVFAYEITDGNGDRSTASVQVTVLDTILANNFPVSRVSAGDRPFSLATVDLNGDGVLDVLTANRNSNDVSVLLGTGDNGVGDGRFEPATAFGAGDGPSSVVTADLNSDGVLDVITANRNSNDVSVLIGTGSGGVGDGGFATAVAFASGERPASVVTADLNGDGVLDVITANEDTDDVSVLLGTGSGGVGDGGFEPAVAFAAGEGPRSVVTADVNGDGVLDVFTASHFSDPVSVLIGTGTGGVGDGGFEPVVTFAAGDGPLSVVTADVDGDGALDILTRTRTLEMCRCCGSVSLSSRPDGR